MKYKRLLIFSILFSLAVSCKIRDNSHINNDQSPGYTIAAYYFPNYHVDKRNEKILGKDWTEWELVKKAKPRFNDHHQPKVPEWGYTDESKPEVMAQKIKAAADNGIDVFIFDWYYYNDGPFLEDGLEKGFQKAPNKQRMKFALMWANHNWVDIFPKKAGEKPKLLFPGKISPATWDTMTDYIITHYFKDPSYWKIDGKPYFSIYDLTRFLEIFGSDDKTIEGIKKFRDKVKEAGFPGLNLNAVVWGNTILPSTQNVVNAEELVKKLGFNSTTSYVWIHHVPLPDFPQTPYKYVEDKYFEFAKSKEENDEYLPYIPNVSMGWDPSPRCGQEDGYKNTGYPCMATISGSTPSAFKNALGRMKEFVDKHPGTHNILNINSWNEWTEGSYLEPDTTHGMAYLNAIKQVFSRDNPEE